MTTVTMPDHEADRAIPRAMSGAVLVLIVAGIKVVVHLLTTGAFGYGYFVDELYFLACSHHLAWGFVDMPPLFPALTALVRTTLGDSLFAIRLVPTLAGGALVLLSGAIARELGGGKFAQLTAALAILFAPIYLVGYSIDTMNALEPLFWMSCAWLVARMLNGGSEKLWIPFGVVAGLGLLNKHSMAFFGVGVLVAVVATSQRSILRRRWVWIGGLVAFAIFLPNLVWEIGHHFPHLEQLANIRADGRDVSLGSLMFILEQILMLQPIAAPIWIGGLVWLLVDRDGRRYRTLGIVYLVVLGLMLVLHGRVYYLAPIYPMLFAAGGVAIERHVLGKRWAKIGVPIYGALYLVSSLLLAPTMLPMLPPETYVRYSKALHIDQPRIENHKLGPLPQLFADRFGWKEMAETVAKTYDALPPEVREKTAIFGQNYGQAGAIDLYGPSLGLPPALSGHLSYYYWGPRGYSGDSMIVLDDDRETLEKIFRDVKLVGHVTHPYSMPYQHFDVYYCRHMRNGTLAELWPKIKKFH